MKSKKLIPKYKCIPFIIENTWLNGMDHGWGNGYIAIDKTHPLFGKSYSDKIKCDVDKVQFNGNYIGLLVNSMSEDRSEVSLDMVLNVHCGITYSNELNESFMVNTIAIGDALSDTDYWIFGFDTVHCDDTSENWTKEDVIAETLKFKQQLESFTL